MAVTRPKSPNFSKPKSKPLERDQFNETHPTIEKFKAASPKKVRPVSAKPVKQPSSTRAMALTQQKRREEIEATRMKEEQERLEEADRKKKQERVRFITCHLCLVERHCVGLARHSSLVEREASGGESRKGTQGSDSVREKYQGAHSAVDLTRPRKTHAP